MLSDTAISGGGTTAPGVTTLSINNTNQTTRSMMLARLNTGETLEQFLETF